MTKVKLPREVAEAIELFLTECAGGRTDEEQRSVLVAEHCGCDWRLYEVGQYAALNDITTFKLMQALVNGYEVEKTPEDAVREYYEISRMWVEDAGNVTTPSVKYKLGVLDGITTTLNLLGIKIGGINA